MKRTELEIGAKLCLSNMSCAHTHVLRDVRVDRYLGCGSKVIVYEVSVPVGKSRDGREIRARYAMKELWPEQMTGQEQNPFSKVALGQVRHDAAEDICRVQDEDGCWRLIVGEKYRGAYQDIYQEYAQNVMEAREAEENPELQEYFSHVHDVFQAGDGFYFLCEEEKGVALEGYVPGSVMECLQIMEQLCQAIDKLHQAGWYFMDLNPKNVLYYPDEQAPERRRIRFVDTDSLYAKGLGKTQILCTEPYVFPPLREAIQGRNKERKTKEWTKEQVDTLLEDMGCQSDLYCLGLIFYTLFLGKKPSAAYGSKGFLTEIADADFAKKVCRKGGKVSAAAAMRVAGIIRRAMLFAGVVPAYLREESLYGTTELRQAQEGRNENKDNYRTAGEMAQDIMTLEKILQKKERPVTEKQRKEFYLLQAFQLLTDHPLFQYLCLADENSKSSTFVNVTNNTGNSNYGNAREAMEVVIAGAHPSREEYLRVILSIAHVLTISDGSTVSEETLSTEPLFMKLRIHIVAEDAVEFWTRLCDACPELVHCVRVWRNGIYDKTVVPDPSLVAGCTAEIFLENALLDPAQEAQFLRKHGRYYLLLHENVPENYLILRQLAEEGNDFFAAILTEKISTDAYESVLHRARQSGEIFLLQEQPIYDADRKEFRTSIEAMGFQVHLHYSRGLHMQKMKLIRKEYMGQSKRSVYNRFSSIRSAATFPYKMYSLKGRSGSDFSLQDLDAAEQYAEAIDRDSTHNVALHRGNYYDLVNLEHRSWEMWLIMNGYVRPETRYPGVPRIQILQRLFAENGKCMSMRDKVHCCLVPSWKRMDIADIRQNPRQYWEDPSFAVRLDPLDQLSAELYQFARKQKKENQARLDTAWQMLSDELNQFLKTQEQNTIAQGSGMYLNVTGRNAVLRLNDAYARVQNLAPGADQLWSEAVNELRSVLEQGNGMASVHLVDYVNMLLTPSLEAAAHRSYKSSDAEIVRAIPAILTADRIRIIYKAYIPESTKFWMNIYSSVVMNPDRLVLVTRNGERARAGRIQKFLDERGCQIRVEEKNLDMYRNEPLAQEAVLDLTGITNLITLDQYEAVFPRNKFREIFVRDGKIVARSRRRGEAIFTDTAHLTVADSFILTGARVISENSSMEENTLEAYIYSTCIRYQIFDDVRMGVNLAYGGTTISPVSENASRGETDDAGEAIAGQSLARIDVAGTRNGQTFLMICRQHLPRTAYPALLYEIRRQAEEFGICGVPILVTTDQTGHILQEREADTTSNQKDIYFSGRKTNAMAPIQSLYPGQPGRPDDMGEFLNRARDEHVIVIGPDILQTGEENLAKILRQIAGK